MRKIRVILFLIVLADLVYSQDIHFSQFNEHHALVNPALTGTGKLYRAVLAYKNQWRTVSTPYKTFGASYESRVLNGSWKKGDELPKKFREQNIGRMGAGLSVYRDRSGAGDMSLTQVNLSVASYIPTSRWSFISVGLQSSMAFRRIDQTTLVFPNQYVPGGYDATLNHGEDIPLDRFRYMDFGAGALWSYGYQEKSFATGRQIRGKFGIAVYHLTQPNLRVIGRMSEQLFRKYVAHGDMIFTIPKTVLALAPAFIFQMQGPTTELVAGATLKYYTTPANNKFTGAAKSTCLNFGLYYRTKDAVIMQFLLEYQEKYAYGLSYDLNVSPLRAGSRLRGGLELTVRITPQEEHLYQKR